MWKRSAFLILLLIVCRGTHAQQSTFQFDHLSVRENLSSNIITSIVRDTTGYIWIGTITGLNRYDGYNIQQYHNEPQNPHSLVNDHIVSLHLDRQGTLWVGMSSGLCRYDPLYDRFEEVRLMGEWDTYTDRLLRRMPKGVCGSVRMSACFAIQPMVKV